MNKLSKGQRDSIRSLRKQGKLTKKNLEAEGFSKDIIFELEQEQAIPEWDLGAYLAAQDLLRLKQLHFMGRLSKLKLLQLGLTARTITNLEKCGILIQEEDITGLYYFRVDDAIFRGKQH